MCAGGLSPEARSLELRVAASCRRPGERLSITFSAPGRDGGTEARREVCSETAWGPEREPASCIQPGR